MKLYKNLKVLKYYKLFSKNNFFYLQGMYFTDKLNKNNTSFKNSISLDRKNMSINKDLSSISVSLINLKKYNLQEKTFVLATNNTIDDIISLIENEYNLNINIDDNEKKIITDLLEYTDFKHINSKNTNLLKTMQDILKKLNIKSTDQEYSYFIDLLRESSNINDLKRQFMLVNVELENMENIKNLIDKKVKFRLNIILIIILSGLIYITYLFYNAIYNVDELGWDLVEPTTYLFNCIVFLICLFAFVKLQRGFYSATDLYDDLYRSFKIKRYLQYNFNYKKYDKLLMQKDMIMKKIETTSKI